MENPMHVHFLLIKCLLIIHITCLHIPSAESMVRQTGWQTEGWTIVHPPAPTADTGRKISTTPQGGQDYSLDPGATQRADMDPYHGDFGGFTGRRIAKGGRVRHFGQFNSDTHGCGGIQTRSCTSSSHCTGCLGLYSCNVILGKCQLKGLSQQTDKFLQTLRDF